MITIFYRCLEHGPITVYSGPADQGIQVKRKELYIYIYIYIYIYDISSRLSQEPTDLSLQLATCVTTAVPRGVGHVSSYTLNP